ncbi:hypothetical protein [Campylobacter sp. MIT 97-5078]|uniref:hypothetical protein n=1 Tax=Campylobacter sp. MIT 97-5078 TaxID=1548153 RepID=UPI00163C09E4|nr:hypothetical protein [Campylobacter sp. MIT 97-5078]
MFHIVFSSDERYAKYTAVMMYSIIKNTKTSKYSKWGGGVFDRFPLFIYIITFIS